MGFCANCGEILGRDGRCRKCGSSAAVNPVSGDNDPYMAERPFGSEQLAVDMGGLQIDKREELLTAEWCARQSRHPWCQH